MKVSDYIVAFLVENQITDVFGYPGGMVTHLMESLDKYRDRVRAHVNYHEQASAMAACGWAEVTGLPGVAYATSGPGATNLLTGIACAYFESLPCMFITGQVNTYEQKGTMGVRQRGFQETDIVSMAKPVTKDAFMVTEAEQVPAALESAFKTAMSGRRGPVLIDIPMNIFRGEIDALPRKVTLTEKNKEYQQEASEILAALASAKRPVILAGHGISLAGVREEFRALVDQLQIPVVTSMIAVDVLPTDHPMNYGMIGAYGARCANFIIDHSDCILTLGSRMDCRQTGVNKALFAPNAKILRVDIDEGELGNRTNADEQHFIADLKGLLPTLLKGAGEYDWNYPAWHDCCVKIAAVIREAEDLEPGNWFAKKLGQMLPDDLVITTDVGQNQVWIAQSMGVKKNQRVLFSGGHGAMGYSLPAAIGAAAAGHRVVCVCGDGGLQMNIQELEFLVREQLPIKVVLLNNRALGMIHHFQEMYFNSNYMQTDARKGYTTPSFAEIAQAYGLNVISEDRLNEAFFTAPDPGFVEITLPETTHVFPKLGLNKPIHEQEPPLSRAVMDRLYEMIGEMTE